MARSESCSSKNKTQAPRTCNSNTSTQIRRRRHSQPSACSEHRLYMMSSGSLPTQRIHGAADKEATGGPSQGFPDTPPRYVHDPVVSASHRRRKGWELQKECCGACITSVTTSRQATVPGILVCVPSTPTLRVCAFVTILASIPCI